MAFSKSLLLCLLSLLTVPCRAALKDIDHVVVLYQENWSFDTLYGSFPGADGLAEAGKAAIQSDAKGIPYPERGMPLWEPGVCQALGAPAKSTCFLPNGPFNLADYLSPGAKTAGDPPHKFYTEQLQINGGKMDRFVAWSSVSGLAMSYYDASKMPEGKLAAQFTLCDHFFHGAFGGSFLNHIWMVSAQAPRVPVQDGVAVCADASGAWLALTATGQISSSQAVPGSPALDKAFSKDDGSGIFYAVNTISAPYMPRFNASFYLPPLTNTNLGDLLSAHQTSWKWYSGGWDMANASTSTASAGLFQFHHQPFNYWAEFAPGSASRTAHLADENGFLRDLKAHKLPQVCFIKPMGPNNEHPNYASLAQGQEHASSLVQAVMKSSYWKHCMIVITYDEHGGRWDHVGPPGSPDAPQEVKDYSAEKPGRYDAWGPGSRVPTILISPYVRKGYVDHRIYETSSILALLEDRFANGARLGARDAAVNSLEMALIEP
jgi:phospholipase C